MLFSIFFRHHLITSPLSLFSGQLILFAARYSRNTSTNYFLSWPTIPDLVFVNQYWIQKSLHWFQICCLFVPIFSWNRFIPYPFLPFSFLLKLVHPLSFFLFQSINFVCIISLSKLTFIGKPENNFIAMENCTGNSIEIKK